MQIQKQLNDHNIRYERFDAVNGSELDVHKLSLSIRAESVLRLRKKKTELDIDSMGHIGSYLSHYALWGKCVENKKDYNAFTLIETHSEHILLRIMRLLKNAKARDEEVITPIDFEISPIIVPPLSIVVAPVYVFAPVKVNVFNLYW